MSTSNTKKVILAKSVDWDPWISFVRKRAKASRIWEYVDPSLSDKPAQPLPPTKPILARQVGGAVDPIALEVYKLDLVEYKAELAEYERQEKAFGDLGAFIQDTIAAHNAVFIQYEDHPWNVLVALKNRLAPSDESRSLAVEQRYQKLCNGPGTQDIETWLDQWVTTYTEAKKIPIGEMIGTRPLRDFLMAVKQKEPSFANAHLIQLKKKTDSDDIFEVIEDLRQQLSFQKLQRKGGGEHTAFAAKVPAAKSGASFRGQSQGQPQSQSQPPKPCICGDTHWILDCHYLVPEKRPQGWRSNPLKQRKVDEALQNSNTRA